MDIFTEQMVKKTKTATDSVIKGLMIFLTVILTAVILLISLMLGSAILSIGVLLIAGIIYGCYYLIKQRNIEYEYILTNGEIDVDKIINQSKRKRLLTVKVSDFENFGALSGAPEAEQKAVFFTVGGECEQYYADFKHSKYGNVRWIFSPDEKMLNAIKPYLKHTLK